MTLDEMIMEFKYSAAEYESKLKGFREKDMRTYGMMKAAAKKLRLVEGWLKELKRLREEKDSDAIRCEDCVNYIDHRCRVADHHVAPFSTCLSVFGAKRREEGEKNCPIEESPQVIRCRDCGWWEKQADSLQGRCSLLGIYPTGSWYCANANAGIYPCDPEKNAECKKTDCYINGGPCNKTTRKECRIEE